MSMKSYWLIEILNLSVFLGDIFPSCFVKQVFIFTFRPTQARSILILYICEPVFVADDGRNSRNI